MGAYTDTDMLGLVRVRDRPGSERVNNHEAENSEGHAPMITRSANRRDAAEIARLHIESWRATYVNDLPPDFLAEQDLAGRTARWEARFAEGVHVLLAEDAGALVGFVAFGPAHDPESFEAGDWEIHNIHVDPARHGQGIGRALFERAVCASREHGASGVMLWVVRTNRNARDFYEHMGMLNDGGEQEHTVQPGISLHEVRYRLPLAPVKGSPVKGSPVKG